MPTREKPILMSAPMVLALLAGTKTQTRRVAKPQPEEVGWGRNCIVKPYCTGTNWPLAYYERRGGGCWNSSEPLKCPYGVPGDRLWVRETHFLDPPDDGTWGYTQWSGCKESTWRDIPERFKSPSHVIYAAQWTGQQLTWRPSIFMPRWASRITLEIISVRVERVREISENDCYKEGIPRPAGPRLGSEVSALNNARGNYRDLWDSINKPPHDWATNPWVWVVEFKRV